MSSDERVRSWASEGPQPLTRSRISASEDVLSRTGTCHLRGAGLGGDVEATPVPRRLLGRLSAGPALFAAASSQRPDKTFQPAPSRAAPDGGSPREPASWEIFFWCRISAVTWIRSGSNPAGIGPSAT